MKRKFFTGLIIGIMIFMTSCQFIEKAIEDTFATQPAKFNEEEDKKDKSFFEKIEDIFLDESNKKVFILDIVSDAEDKMGFEFSTELDSNLKKYIMDNDIERYMSKEEIIEVARKNDENNLILNNKKLNEIKEKLIEKLGTEDLYVNKGQIRINNNGFYIDLVNPENPQYVDIYYYNLGSDSWHIVPKKLSGYIVPMEESIHLSEIPFDSIERIVDTGIEILKEMGDYREFDIMNQELGIKSIYTNLKEEGLIYRTTVYGTREDYNLIFDINGNLLEKERY